MYLAVMNLISINSKRVLGGLIENEVMRIHQVSMGAGSIDRTDLGVFLGISLGESRITKCKLPWNLLLNI